jgi:hypothetical protein
MKAKSSYLSMGDIRLTPAQYEQMQNERKHNLRGTNQEL